jgi:hypothetical protein
MARATAMFFVGQDAITTLDASSSQEAEDRRAVDAAFSGEGDSSFAREIAIQKL